MKNLLYFFLITLLVLSCSRCKEEECFDANNPACENYNPCLSKQPLSADFKMFSSGSFAPEGSEILDGDTAWCKRQITFQTIQTDIDSVQWLIGSDPQIHRDLQFSITFGQPYYNVPIRCIVFGPQDENCFGSAYTSDTIVKHLSMVNWPDLPIWTYRFRCHYDYDPSNEFDIHFEIEVDPNSPIEIIFGDRYLIGIEPEGNCLYTGINTFNHAFIDLHGLAPPSCYMSSTINPTGSLSISPDKKTIKGPISPAYPYQIAGYRIN